MMKTIEESVVSGNVRQPGKYDISNNASTIISDALHVASRQKHYSGKIIPEAKKQYIDESFTSIVELTKSEWLRSEADIAAHTFVSRIVVFIGCMKDALHKRWCNHDWGGLCYQGSHEEEVFIMCKKCHRIQSLCMLRR